MYAGTKKFMPALGFIHLSVLVPLFFVPTKAVGEKPSFAAVGFKKLTLVLTVIAAVVHYGTTMRVLRELPSGDSLISVLGNAVISHPAQGSVSLDVVWVGVTAVLLFLLTGSAAAIAIKFGLLIAAAAVVAARRLGINWILIASCFPLVLLLLVAAAAYWLSQVRSRNTLRRDALFSRLGIQEGVVPGTATEPPKVARRRLVAGFWHPYW
jgi:alpha-1,2-mannosyltransferase